jgi:hypothetical protein
MTKRRGDSPLCTPHILSFPRKRESSRTRRVGRAERNPPVLCLRSICSIWPISLSAQIGQPRIRKMRRYRALVSHLGGCFTTIFQPLGRVAMRPYPHPPEKGNWGTLPDSRRESSHTSLETGPRPSDGRGYICQFLFHSQIGGFCYPTPRA